MKGLKLFAACVAAAFTLGSCMTGMGTDDIIDGPTGSAKLTLSVSPSRIAADGQTAARFTVACDDVELGAGDVTFYMDGSVVELPDMEFTTDEPGTYTFYATYDGEEGELKSNTVSVTATDGSGPADPAIPEVDLSRREETGLSVTPSSTVFQLGAECVVFVIRYNGEVVTSGYTFYNAKGNSRIEMETVTIEQGGKSYDLPAYYASEAGSLSFWVNYGTANTAKNPTTVTAVNFPVPSRPVDPEPDNLSFRHRSLLLEFTGTGCGYCPYMIAALHDVLAESAYEDNAVLAVAHTYNSSDPMYVDPSLETSFGLSGAPYLVVDFATSFTNYGYETNKSRIRAAIDSSLATASRAGIAVNMDYADGIVIARASVKAAAAGDFYVGAYLLESGISAQQSNYGMSTAGYDFSTHNNAIRVLDCKEGSRYIGHPLGTLAAGDIVDYLFVIDVDPEWVEENCHMVFFVTSSNGTSYRATNVIRTEGLSDSVDFEYE